MFRLGDAVADADKNEVAELLEEIGLSEGDMDSFAGNLVWRIGRLNDEAPVTVRVGLASSVPMFNDLPKLRNASESEIEAAMQEDSIRVEWVGHMPR